MRPYPLPFHFAFITFFAGISKTCYCVDNGASLSQDDVAVPPPGSRKRKLWRRSAIDVSATGVTAAFPVEAASSRKEDRRKKNNLKPSGALNCTYGPSSNRRRPWRRKRRTMMRRSYRIAVLAKLAYWDFQLRGDDIHEQQKQHHHLSFSLSDDPAPPLQLLPLANRGPVQSGKTDVMASHSINALMVRLRIWMCRARSKLAELVLTLANLEAVHYGIALKNKNETNAESLKVSTNARCQGSLLDRLNTGRRYQIEWALQNWHEPSRTKVRWHDTDLIVATSGKSELVLAFAGTASTKDHFTNVQTFVSVTQSGLFGEGTHQVNNSTMAGSMHRGFLHAYSRVVSGTLLKLCDDSPLMGSVKNATVPRCEPTLTESLHRRYETCMAIQKQDRRRKRNKKGKKEKKRRKKENSKDGRRRQRIDCQSHGVKLMDILRDTVTGALESGQTVHLGGHSLGGGIATILALDIIMNFPSVPIARLNLWTYGAPEVADSVFYDWATSNSPRLGRFLSDRRRYHRFVTRADNCATDFVASIASRAMRGRGARRLGGLRGSAVHPVEPLYLPLGAARSGIEGHFMGNYLKGISDDAPDQELTTDFPSPVKTWLGEAQA